jgi:hypothetical protein
VEWPSGEGRDTGGGGVPPAGGESAPGLARVWCGRYADYLRSAPPQTYKFPDGLRWVRLSHPADRNRWIGLGVRDMYNTGWTAHAILCRVPVGFSPNP